MARYDRDWDNFGQQISDIIDHAVNAQDYRELNRDIRQVVNQAVGSITGRPTRGVGSQVVHTGEVIDKKEELPLPYGSTSDKTTAGLVKAAGGGVLCFGTFVAFVPSAMMHLFFGGSIISPGTLVLGLGFAAGAALLYSGVKTLGMVRRFKAYRRVLGNQTHISLEKLSRAVGRNIDFVRKELQQMIDQGLFLEGHLDNEGQNLITSNETFRHYEQSRLALEERQRLEAAEKLRRDTAAQASQDRRAKADPRVQEVLDKGDAYLAEIRRCNDLIPGEEISGKISRMEGLVEKIFQRAEAHPEIVPDLKKLMDYYLPMTVKLLRAYADMDAQGVQGDTIQSSKREIEAALDTLNIAFEKLLDSVFQDTALDVSSDISVLNTLLAQEGLVEDDINTMHKDKNTTNQ